MLYIDKYAYCNRLTNTNPFEKFLFVMATMIICLWANSIIISMLIILLMIGVAVFKGGIPLSFYLKLMLIPFFFLITGITTIAVNTINDYDKMLWGFKVYSLTMGVTAKSLEIAARLFIKALGTVSCLYFLSLTTPMIEIISVLKKLKCPVLFLELMSLVYRFIFILLETADKIVTSQSSRLGYYGFKNGFHSMGQLVSTLFIRSYKRSQDLYTALEARCYNGELNVLEEKYQISKKNIILIFLIEVFLVIITILIGGRF